MECILKYSKQQEALSVDMILQNNSIRMREIQQWVVKDNLDFGGIIRFSLCLHPPARPDALILRKDLHHVGSKSAAKPQNLKSE